MATRDLTAQNFMSTLEENPIVLVDFWAAWCGPCRNFAPVFDAASQKHSDVVFAKVDTESEQALASQAQITSIPTLMAFRDGILVFQQAGALPPAGLEQVIEGVKGLDMDAVRQQIEHAEAHPDEISLDDFAAAHAGGGRVLDVREANEFESGHVPGAQHVPMNDVPNALADLPRDQPIYVICEVGGRSRKITDFLQSQGLQAINVTDGTAGWRKRGWPLNQ